MSPRISRIYPLLLALCLLLPSCTLLDNDLRPESEKQEAAPDTTNYIHEQTDEYTASYQYSDQTRVLDEQFLSYVAGIDYSLGTLYLEDFTPDALLPVAGQILAGPICNQLPYGLAHHVVSVTHQNTLYEVRIKRAYIDEVFSHLELEGEFAALSDSLIEDSMDLGNGVKVTRATASDDKDLGGEERGTTLTFTVSSGISSKAIEGLSVTGSAGITLDFRWKPINKVHVYTNTDTNVLDVKLTNGATFTHYITIDGNVALNFDLFEFLQLKELFKKIFHVPLGATVGLPIFLDIYPTLVLSAEVNGRIGVKMIKTFYTDIGAAYGVKGKSNGITFKNHNKELTFEEMPPAEDYAEFYGKAGGSVSAKLGLTADLYFGSPLEQPRVGVKAQVTCGPRIMTSIDTETNGYDDMWKFGFPLNIDGIFYFDLFKKIDPLEWNFVDYLAKAFGQKNGSEFWEFGKQEFRFYPSIDNMRIVCANNMESGSVPQFNVDFDVLTNGSKTGTRIGFRPIYRIFPHNYSSAEPIVEFDPLSGARLMERAGQGFGPGSAWSRGQAWGLYGFTLAHMNTGDARYLDATRRVADFFVAHIRPDGLTDCDFAQPASPERIDNIAGACAACGLIELNRLTGEAGYLAAAETLMDGLIERCCDWSTDTCGLLQRCTASYRDDAAGVHTNIVYGDYFFVEALAKLNGTDPMLWRR